MSKTRTSKKTFKIGTLTDKIALGSANMTIFHDFGSPFGEPGGVQRIKVSSLFSNLDPKMAQGASPGAPKAPQDLKNHDFS